MRQGQLESRVGWIPRKSWKTSSFRHIHGFLTSVWETVMIGVVVSIIPDVRCRIGCGKPRSADLFQSA